VTLSSDQRPILPTADSCPTFTNVTNRRTDRRTVYTRGAVARQSDVVLSAICYIL